MIGMRRLPRRARGLLVVMAPGAVRAVVGWVVAGTVTGSGPAAAGPARHTGGVGNLTAGRGNLYPLGPPGLTGAEKTTVAGAQAKAGYLVPVPSTAAASRANLTQAWVSGSTLARKDREVAHVFDKGKVDILMHRATYQSALRYFHAFLAERNQHGGGTTEIGQGNGRPPLVITPGTKYRHSHPPVVNFWRHRRLLK